MCKSSGNRNGSRWIQKDRRLALYIRDGFACLYCGRDLRNAPCAQVTLDHLTPRCEGGTHDNANLVTACLKCNSARGSKPWRTFAPAGAHARILNARRRKVNIELARGILAGKVPPIELKKAA